MKVYRDVSDDKSQQYSALFCSNIICLYFIYVTCLNLKFVVYTSHLMDTYYMSYTFISFLHVKGLCCSYCKTFDLIHITFAGYLFCWSISSPHLPSMISHWFLFLLMLPLQYQAVWFGKWSISSTNWHTITVFSFFAEFAYAVFIWGEYMQVVLFNCAALVSQRIDFLYINWTLYLIRRYLVFRNFRVNGVVL